MQNVVRMTKDKRIVVRILLHGSALNTRVLVHTLSAHLALLFSKSVLVFPIVPWSFSGGIVAACLSGLNSVQAEGMRGKTEGKPGDVDMMCGEGTATNTSP